MQLPAGSDLRNWWQSHTVNAPVRQHSVMEFPRSNHIMAFVDIAANMRLHSCCFTIARTLPTSGIAEVYPFYADAGFPCHQTTCWYPGNAVITAGVILPQHCCLNLWVLTLAQSWVISTFVSTTSSRTVVGALSFCRDHSWCAFQACIACTAFWWV